MYCPYRDPYHCKLNGPDLNCGRSTSHEKWQRLYHHTRSGREKPLCTSVTCKPDCNAWVTHSPNLVFNMSAVLAKDHDKLKQRTANSNNKDWNIHSIYLGWLDKHQFIWEQCILSLGPNKSNGPCDKNLEEIGVNNGRTRTHCVYLFETNTLPHWLAF